MNGVQPVFRRLIASSQWRGLSSNLRQCRACATSAIHPEKTAEPPENDKENQSSAGDDAGSSSYDESLMSLLNDSQTNAKQIRTTLKAIQELQPETIKGAEKMLSSILRTLNKSRLVLNRAMEGKFVDTFQYATELWEPPAPIRPTLEPGSLEFSFPPVTLDTCDVVVANGMYLKGTVLQEQIRFHIGKQGVQDLFLHFTETQSPRGVVILVPKVHSPALIDAVKSLRPGKGYSKVMVGCVKNRRDAISLFKSKDIGMEFIKELYRVMTRGYDPSPLQKTIARLYRRLLFLGELRPEEGVGLTKDDMAFIVISKVPPSNRFYTESTNIDDAFLAHGLIGVPRFLLFVPEIPYRFLIVLKMHASDVEDALSKRFREAAVREIADGEELCALLENLETRALFYETTLTHIGRLRNKSTEGWPNAFADLLDELSISLAAATVRS